MARTTPQRQIEQATFSIHDSAGYLGIPLETLRSWLRRGVLRRVKIQGRVLIRRSELDRLIAEGEADAESA